MIVLENEELKKKVSERDRELAEAKIIIAGLRRRVTELNSS